MSELIMGNYCFNTPSVNLCSDFSWVRDWNWIAKTCWTPKSCSSLSSVGSKNEWLNLFPPPPWDPVVNNIKGHPGHSHRMSESPWSVEWYVTCGNNGPVSLSCPSFYKPSIKPQQGRDKPWPTIMVSRAKHSYHFTAHCSCCHYTDITPLLMLNVAEDNIKMR